MFILSHRKNFASPLHLIVRLLNSVLFRVLVRLCVTSLAIKLAFYRFSQIRGMMDRYLQDGKPDELREWGRGVTRVFSNFSINGCRLCKGGWGVCPEKERGRGTCSFTNKLKSKSTEVLFPAFWAPARSQA